MGVSFKTARFPSVRFAAVPPGGFDRPADALAGPMFASDAVIVHVDAAVSVRVLLLAVFAEIAEPVGRVSGAFSAAAARLAAPFVALIAARFAA